MTPTTIWLASYPKSGNTWLRLLFANYLNESPEPVDINDLDNDTHLLASSRAFFDDVVGVEASDLTSSEIRRLRPASYGYVRHNARGLLLVKVHDAYCGPNLPPLLPPGDTSKVIYVVRNPLDVAVSLTHHFKLDADRAVEWLCNGVMLSKGGAFLSEQLDQVLLDWSGHVRSWLHAPEIAVHVLRYEDLLADPAAALIGALDHCGVRPELDRVAKAVEFSTLDRLRQQERRDGFRERPAGVQQFFRKGIAGEGRLILTQRQVSRICDAHRAMMTRLGYDATAEQQ